MRAVRSVAGVLGPRRGWRTRQRRQAPPTAVLVTVAEAVVAGGLLVGWPASLVGIRGSGAAAQFCTGDERARSG
jgi:hypothetical protein